jgi:hypothetical protein
MSIIIVPADPDQDDCLSAAAEIYIEEHPELEGYDLCPVWGDDNRETVALTVPGWVGLADSDDSAHVEAVS